MIVKGYNGIMDLDLTHVPEKLHKELIVQHHRDIMDYKVEQANMPERLRYENTVLVAEKRMKTLRVFEAKRLHEAEMLRHKKQDDYNRTALSYISFSKDNENN